MSAKTVLTFGGDELELTHPCAGCKAEIARGFVCNACKIDRASLRKLTLQEANGLIGKLDGIAMTARAQIEMARRAECSTDSFEKKCVSRAEHYEEISLVMREIMERTVALDSALKDIAELASENGPEWTVNRARKALTE